MIKAIWMDIDNTLLDFDAYVHDAMKEGMARFGMPPFREEMLPVFHRENGKLWRRIEEGTLTFEELQKIRFRNIFQALGMEVDGPAFETFFRSYLWNYARLVKGADQMLELLPGELVLCTASNGPYDQQVHRMEISGIGRFFRHHFISEKLGASKPSPVFFEAGMSEMNRRQRELGLEELRPENVLMFGDSLTSDMAGGLTAGMQTCWYRRNPGENAGEIRPDVIIDRLTDLVKVILNSDGIWHLPKQMGVRQNNPRSAGSKKMKKLGFGWMRLPILNPLDKASIDQERVNRLADEFLSQGFTYFDTAYMYHNYESENSLRRAVVERYPRDAFRLADKLPLCDIHKAEDIPRIYEDQKKKCGVSYFDTYLLHNMNSSNYAAAEEMGAISFLLEKKAGGEIRELGFSFHDTADLLDRIFTEHPELEFVQLQLNYLDWENEGVQSRKCYETARKHGKEVIVMEPCKGGTLARIPQEAEDMLREVHPDWSMASWAIRFAAGLPGVRMVLSGMSDESQLQDNLRTMTDFQPLTEAEKALLFRVRDKIAASIAIPCTGCRYCVEGDRCPQNLLIPNYFTLYNQEQINTNPSWSSEKEYYTNLTIAGYGRAEDCIHCGSCESVCPQHIPIRDWLEKISFFFDAQGSGRTVTGERVFRDGSTEPLTGRR